MIVRIDAKAWGVAGSNLSVGLTLSVLISNFDSPLRENIVFLNNTINPTQFGYKKVLWFA